MGVRDGEWEGGFENFGEMPTPKPMLFPSYRVMGQNLKNYKATENFKR